jgi:hypothetical protein
MKEQIHGARQRFNEGGGVKGAAARAGTRVAERYTSEAGHQELKRHGLNIVDQFMARKAQEAQYNRGLQGAVMSAAFSFAREHLRNHMAALGEQQRLFENCAKIHRGDVSDLSSKELLEVQEKAHKFGGRHAESIAASAELMLAQRVTERTRHGEEARTSARLARGEAVHTQHMAHMGEIQEAKKHARTAQEKAQLEHEEKRAKQQYERRAKQNGFASGDDLAAHLHDKATLGVLNQQSLIKERKTSALAQQG